MIDLPFLAGQTIAVLGLGRSGLIAAEAAHRAGARVWAWDDDAARRAALSFAATPLADAPLDQAAMLVLSPGIAHTFPTPHPVAARAKAAGCPVVGDVELLVRADREAAVIGITGTNGKSTTTALTGHILKACGRRIEIGGNLGTPVLSFERLGAGGIYVLELSSYQLELTPSLACDAAILLNITPDHLDRHGGMDGYVAAKALILGAAKTAIVGIDETVTAELAARHPGTIRLSVRAPVAGGISGFGGRLVDDHWADEATVIDLATCPALPGAHNAQNAGGAYAACRALGLAPDAIAGALVTFPGLAHRQERIATIKGVLFVNDSKATNAEAAERALVCYDHIYWIAGGVAKDGGIAALVPHLGRVRRAYLIGEAAAQFQSTIGDRCPVMLCRRLDDALAAIHRDLAAERPGAAVVLLSPAAASFDHYDNFEQRGAHFRSLVEKMWGLAA